jgi:hypothetical protein
MLTKATPLLAGISLLVSAVSVGMTLFGKQTDTATEAIKRQVTELERLRAQLQDAEDARASRARAGIPFEDPAAKFETMLERAAAIRRTGRETFFAAEAQRMLGVGSEQEMRRLLARGGLGEAALETETVRNRLRRFGEPELMQRYRMQEFDREALARAAEQRAGDLYRQQNPPPRYGPTREEANTQLQRIAEEDLKIQQAREEQRARFLAQKDEYLRAIADDAKLAGMSADVREREQAVLQLVNAAKREGMEVNEQEIAYIREQIGLQQQLNELYQFGAQFGGALASNVWDAFIQRGNIARNLVAGLLNDLANIGRQTFAQGLSQFFGRAAAGFATTLRQGAASAGSGGSSIGAPAGGGYD